MTQPTPTRDLSNLQALTQASLAFGAMHAICARTDADMAAELQLLRKTNERTMEVSSKAIEGLRKQVTALTEERVLLNNRNADLQQELSIYRTYFQCCIPAYQHVKRANQEVKAASRSYPSVFESFNAKVIEVKQVMNLLKMHLSGENGDLLGEKNIAVIRDLFCNLIKATRATLQNLEDSLSRIPRIDI